MNPARRLWTLFERIHAVTYFAEEAVAAARDAGYRGFFMGYFALRAAPLGPVGPNIATASFFGFHASRAERALPDAWAYAGPERALAARLAGVDRVLQRVWDLSGERARIAAAADLLWDAAQSADVAGRVLAAANQALVRPEPAHLALWQAATTLREHRGDGHVAVLVADGVGPVEAMVVKCAAGEADGVLLRSGRGWPEEDWLAAEESLRTRGWLAGDGMLTAAGEAAHQAIEDRTDAAAASPWQALGEERTNDLARLLGPLVDRIVTADTVPAVNPIGLPLPR